MASSRSARMPLSMSKLIYPAVGFSLRRNLETGRRQTNGGNGKRRKIQNTVRPKGQGVVLEGQIGWLFLSKVTEVSHLRDRFTLFAFSTVLSQGQYIHLYHVDSAAAFVLPPVRGSLLFKSLNLVFPRSEVKFSTARDASGSRVTLDAYLRKDPQPLDITTSLLYCLLFMAPLPLSLRVG